MKVIGTLTMGTLTTLLGALLMISIGLVDNWVFHSQLVGKDPQISDLTLILVGVAALLGHNPLSGVSSAATTVKSA